MPEAGSHPDDEDVENVPDAGAAAAAERDIEIIPEPCAERHVPAPPELRDALCDIRIAEVFREREAEDAAQPDGHIAVAGEIEIDLEREGDRVQPGIERRLLGRSLIGGDELRKDVRNEHLLPETDREARSARGRGFERVCPLLQLGRDIAVAHDWARDELREHGNIGGKIDKIMLRRHIAAVYVDLIAGDLKRIEADADRQGDLQKRER